MCNLVLSEYKISYNQSSKINAKRENQSSCGCYNILNLLKNTQNIFEIHVIDQSNTVKTMTQHFDFVSKKLK